MFYISHNVRIGTARVFAATSPTAVRRNSLQATDFQCHLQNLASLVVAQNLCSNLVCIIQPTAQRLTRRSPTPALLPYTPIVALFFSPRST